MPKSMMLAVGKEFSACLAKLRREAGFKTAYQFYHSNGGRRHFPFTYVHYLRLERKGRLPRPHWMGLLMLSLRLSPGDAGCRVFFKAYLRNLLGSEEAFDLILGPLLDRSQKELGSPMALGLGLMKSEHSMHLTPEQFRALAWDEATYWCSETLLNDDQSWTAHDLAHRLGFGSAAVAKGLKRLKSAGLVEETGSGRFRSRQPGKFCTFPGRLTNMQGPLKAVQGYWEKMYGRRGAPVNERVELIRAESGFIGRYWTGLAEALDAANTGATRNKGEKTGLFLIEAKIRQLMPF